MFWFTQGLYLIISSVPALAATIQCGILRKGFAAWPQWLRVHLWLGNMRYQLGRALFFLLGGFYVFPVLSYFSRYADVPWWMGSKFMGIISILSGLFLLIA